MSKGKATSVQVIINIEDVNDNPPIFEQTQYRRHIPNNAVGFEPPLIIKVTGDLLSFVNC